VNKIEVLEKEMVSFLIHVHLIEENNMKYHNYQIFLFLKIIILLIQEEKEVSQTKKEESKYNN